MGLPAGANKESKCLLLLSRLSLSKPCENPNGFSPVIDDIGDKDYRIEYRCAALSNTVHEPLTQIHVPCFLHMLWGRILARNTKMPVQSGNSKVSARPDLAIYLLQILITTSFNSSLEKDNAHFSYVLEDGL